MTTKNAGQVRCGGVASGQETRPDCPRPTGRLTPFLRGPDLPRSCGLGAVLRLHFGLVQIDERDPDVWAHHLAQLRSGLGHDGLQRREYPPLEEVTSACRPVRQAEHDVHAQDGPSRPVATSPISESTSHCSSTRMRR